MQLERFKRKRKTNEKPEVTISHGKVRYSSEFAKLAELDKYSYVTYHYDDKERCLAFEFSKEKTTDEAFVLIKIGGVVKSPAGELISKKDWIRKVNGLKHLGDKKFVARRLLGMWLIQLCPAFENIVPRDQINSIPADAKGIYCYVNYGVVVYIGQGNIRARASEPEREYWVYDTIQYSILSSKEAQLEWENYWLERHKSENYGLLPGYNNQSGIKIIPM